MKRKEVVGKKMSFKYQHEMMYEMKRCEGMEVEN
jgi:hypothetical protein